LYSFLSISLRVFTSKMHFFEKVCKQGRTDFEPFHLEVRTACTRKNKIYGLKKPWARVPATLNEFRNFLYNANTLMKYLETKFALLLLPRYVEEKQSSPPSFLQFAGTKYHTHVSIHTYICIVCSLYPTDFWANITILSNA
jgi:hypothetical protein